MSASAARADSSGEVPADDAPADDRTHQCLDAAGGEALLVFGSHDTPALGPFTGGGRVGHGFAVVPRGDASPHLAYLVGMERDEAARSPYPLIHPEALEVHALREADPSPAAVLAGVVMRALAHCDVRPPGVVALAGTADAGALAPAIFTLAAAGWSLRDGTGLAARLRKAKHDADLASIRRAADGAMAAFRAIARRLAHASIDGDGSESPGALRDADGFVRVGRLRREVAACMLAAGLTQPEGNIIAPGDEGGVPHSVGDDDRVIRAGESLVVDLFPRDRLFADCTRTFCVGPPPPALQHAYATVRAALEHAERSSRPGVRAWTLQQQVCERFAADGYATLLDDPHLTEGYVHGLGHGVGHALHELPSFRETASDDDGRLDVDDVITLEPGLYAPSAGYGVRIEDLYVMRDDGPANLTPLPRDLDPRRWIESP